MAETPERAAAGALSGLLTAALGWALLVGLGVGGTRVVEDGALLAFDVAPPPPPEREEVVPPPVCTARPEGRAAAPNLRSKPTPVVAPAPVVASPVVPPLVAAPVAGLASDPMAGAADRAGPGTGAGGEGDGRGGGGSGDGDGGGGGPERPPIPRSGRLSMAVLPAALRERNGEYSVELRYFVEVDGRATGCRAVRGSGWPELDANACRGVERRFRYRPALDGAGRPVRSVVLGTHSWLVEGEPDAPRRR